VNFADHFARPEMWPLLLVAPVAWILLRVLDVVRGKRFERIVGPRARLLASDEGLHRGVARPTLVAAGVALAALAAMRPVWGEDKRTTDERGPDVVVCLDVSRSMLARDVAPSRLEHAKRAVRALAASAKDGRLALVAFAGEARLVSPLTADMRSFVELADAVDPLTVSRGGTDLGAAIDAARDALGDGAAGAVVLVTDGEDLAGAGLRAAQRCRDAGVVVHCVGLGTPLGGKISVEGAAGETFLRDKSGEVIVSSMDPATLSRIAEATGGAFVDASRDERALVDLYEKRVVPTTRRAVETAERRRRESRFQWPLLAAFALWLLDLRLAGRGRP